MDSVAALVKGVEGGEGAVGAARRGFQPQPLLPAIARGSPELVISIAT